MTIPIISERALPWRAAADMPDPWRLNVLAQIHTEHDGLVLEVEHTTLAERMVERWRLAFEGCVAFKQEPVGFPGNPRLIRVDWSRPLCPPPTTLWIIQGSEWLPTCGTGELEPGCLQHYVVFEATRSRVWHIAARTAQATRLEVPSRPPAALMNGVTMGTTEEVHQP